MNSEIKREIEGKPDDTAVFAAPLPKDVAKHVFRMLYAKDNSLTEVYTRAILVKISDLEDLHKRIAEKVKHYDLFAATFDATVTLESRRSKQLNSWKSFIENDWGTSDVIEQIVLSWRFMIKFPSAPNPASYIVTIRLASPIKPQHLIHAIFSRDPEDLDRFELESVPMSCRVDFADPLLSQELLNIVSEWNKSRPTPEYIFPIMAKIKHHSDTLASVLRYSIPTLSTLACVAYYWEKVRALDRAFPATTALVTNSMLWLAGTGAVLFVTSVIGYVVADYFERQIDRFGRFTVFSITKGDETRQNKLMAKSKNSFWKFIGSGTVAVIWNIVAAILCAIYLRH